MESDYQDPVKLSNQDILTSVLHERPPEADHTIYGALTEVFQTHRPETPVMQSIGQALQSLNERVAAGELSPEEAGQRRLSLEQVRQNHIQRTEAINSWFLDHYFRLFSNEETDDEKLPNECAEKA